MASGIDVSTVNRELDACPDLWDHHDHRTHALDSPHHGVPDIWLRWRDPKEIKSHESYVEPHWPVFWPAWDALPSLHPVIYDLSGFVRSVSLGGILITKTVGGQAVDPHVDAGWHPEFYNFKLYLVLKSNPLCIHTCGDSVENFRAGDVWHYPNNILHSVTNHGKSDHVNVIICCRTEERNRQ